MPVGSKILLYSKDAVECEKLILLLMHQKFVPKAVEAVSYANLALASGEFPIFVCSYSPDDTSTFELLQLMRQDVKMRGVIPVIILNKPTQENISELIKIGCSNFILQSADQQVFINKIEAVAASIGDYSDKRQYPRIEIPEYEKAQLLITARNGNKYPVRVSNLSMGGVQIEWSAEKVPVQKMVIGDVLKNCLLIIKNLDLYADLKIISVFSYKAGARFIDLNEERQTQLCHFIYDKLLSEKSVNS